MNQGIYAKNLSTIQAQQLTQICPNIKEIKNFSGEIKGRETQNLRDSNEIKDKLTFPKYTWPKVNIPQQIQDLREHLKWFEIEK